MSFSLSGNTLYYGGQFDGVDWALNGDFRDFIHAWTEGRDYDSFATHPKIRTENRAIILLKNDVSLLKVSSREDTDSLISALKNYHEHIELVMTGLKNNRQLFLF